MKNNNPQAIKNYFENHPDFQMYSVADRPDMNDYWNQYYPLSTNFKCCQCNLVDKNKMIEISFLVNDSDDNDIANMEYYLVCQQHLSQQLCEMYNDIIEKAGN